MNKTFKYFSLLILTATGTGIMHAGATYQTKITSELPWPVAVSFDTHCWGNAGIHHFILAPKGVKVGNNSGFPVYEQSHELTIGKQCGFKGIVAWIIDGDDKKATKDGVGGKQMRWTHPDNTPIWNSYVLSWNPTNKKLDLMLPDGTKPKLDKQT